MAYYTLMSQMNWKLSSYQPSPHLHHGPAHPAPSGHPVWGWMGVLPLHPGGLQVAAHLALLHPGNEKTWQEVRRRLRKSTRWLWKWVLVVFLLSWAQMVLPRGLIWGWVPVRSLWTIGGWKGQVWWIHLEIKMQPEQKGYECIEQINQSIKNLDTLTFSKEMSQDENVQTHEGRHDPSVSLELRANRWLGEGKCGVAGWGSSRRPMRGCILLWDRRGPSSTLHHHVSPSTALRNCLPSQGGCQCPAPTIPPTRNV